MIRQQPTGFVTIGKREMNHGKLPNVQLCSQHLSYHLQP
jgi:hypothetical protein